MKTKKVPRPGQNLEKTRGAQNEAPKIILGNGHSDLRLTQAKASSSPVSK